MFPESFQWTCMALLISVKNKNSDKELNRGEGHIGIKLATIKDLVKYSKVFSFLSHHFLKLID